MSNNSPWKNSDRLNWLADQKIKRSYEQDVVLSIKELSIDFDLIQYGSLPINADKYPLLLLKNKDWDQTKRTILVTGGVHGYETSGVQGAIRFLQETIHSYTSAFNFIVAPCVSPWGYETINRWNPNAIDPNRSFIENSPSEESKFLMDILTEEKLEILAHFDLHETTDTDNSIFRPALASRDGIEQDNWNIPDGFYLVGDSDKPEAEFQKAIIERVKLTTHIAPADDSERLIGEKVEQFGVINYPTKKLGLCAGFSNAKYVTTTEVYPDSPTVNSEECILAQVEAIIGGLEYIMMNH